ncbi:MAG: hypothetical protein Q4E06_03845 [Lautropia sp.]|nr:hypothetical protein [Lautropia sp.]
MASHNVKFTIPQRDLGKADVVFEVKRDGEKFGDLKVSNGSVVWFPKNAQQGHRTSWTKLDEFFREGKFPLEAR